MKITQPKRPILDVIRFKVPIEPELQEKFFDGVVNPVHKEFCSDKPLILENPGYLDFLDRFKELRYGHWAVRNLTEQKKIPVSLPATEFPDGTYDIYLLTSKKAIKKTDKTFSGFRGFLNTIKDTSKTAKTAWKFSSKVGGAGNDAHYSDAYEFLYEHELNKHKKRRFDKILSKMNIMEVK